jgi:hypothetical protein
MRTNAFLAFTAVCILLLPRSVWAETSETVEHSDSSYSQLVTLEAGPFRPAGIVLSNGSYSFEYGKETLDSYLVEAGWSDKLLNFLGGIYIQEGIGFSTFSGTAPTFQEGTTTSRPLSAYLLSLDTRVMHAWEWFPWKRLIPFYEVGYQYTFYYQAGPSDLESSQGGVGNFVGAAGLRLWLNRNSSLSEDHVNRFASFPIFLTAKVNHIFPQNNGVNLESTTLLAGLSFGI